MGSAGEVLHEDVGIIGVQPGALDGALGEEAAVIDQILVDRSVLGDKDDGGSGAFAADAACLLPEAG